VKTSHKKPISDGRLLSLSARCYAVIDDIPVGRVLTYRDLAEAIGTRGYRAIGRIVGRNPNAPKTPCHRVVRADGKVGGYSARGGIAEKLRLLETEGIKVEAGRVMEFERVRWRFS